MRYFVTCLMLTSCYGVLPSEKEQLRQFEASSHAEAEALSSEIGAVGLRCRSWAFGSTVRKCSALSYGATVAITCTMLEGCRIDP